MNFMKIPKLMYQKEFLKKVWKKIIKNNKLIEIVSTEYSVDKNLLLALMGIETNFYLFRKNGYYFILGYFKF